MLSATLGIANALTFARQVASQYQLATAKGEDRRTGRTFDYVPANELIRVAGMVLPQAGLVLLARDGTVSEWGLARTYRLTHTPSGAVDEWVTTTPLAANAARPDLAVAWARTHSHAAVIRDLLWIGGGEEPDPSEGPSGKQGEPREARTQGQIREQARHEAIMAGANGRGRGSRKAARAAAELADALLGDSVPVYDEQAEDEARQQVEAERLRAEPSSIPPFPDPEWAREDEEPALEDRLRAELERTLSTSRGVRAVEIPHAAPPAPGVLPEAAPSTASECVAQTTTPHPGAPAEGPTTEGSVPEAGPEAESPLTCRHRDEADEATDDEFGAEVARQFLGRENDDASTDPLAPSPAPGPVEASSPAPESSAPGQGAYRAVGADGLLRYRCQCGAEVSDPADMLCDRCAAACVAPEEPSSVRPSGGMTCGTCGDPIQDEGDVTCSCSSAQRDGRDPSDGPSGEPEAESPSPDCRYVGPPHVTCATCAKRKAPVGRDVAAVMAAAYCDMDCQGYWDEPKPDSLWPGEECDPLTCRHRDEPDPESTTGRLKARGLTSRPSEGMPNRRDLLDSEGRVVLESASLDEVNQWLRDADEHDAAQANTCSGCDGSLSHRGGDDGACDGSGPHGGGPCCECCPVAPRADDRDPVAGSLAARGLSVRRSCRGDHLDSSRVDVLRGGTVLLAHVPRGEVEERVDALMPDVQGPPDDAQEDEEEAPGLPDEEGPDDWRSRVSPEVAARYDALDAGEDVEVGALVDPSPAQVAVVSRVAERVAIGPADLRGQKRAKALERAAQREWSRVVVKRGGGTCASNCGAAFRKGDEAEESGNRRRHVVCPNADPRAQEETTS